MRPPALLSHPCARCGELVAGIALGGICAACARAVELRAARWGRAVALGSTLILALYLGVALHGVAPPWRSTGRTIAAAAAVAWCLLTYRIVKRVGLEWLK